MTPLLEAWRRNPFYVLEVPTTASQKEIEREAERIRGMLELGVEAARTYKTPWGPAERDRELVRAAMNTLRDPRARLVHEVLAQLPVDGVLPVLATPPRWQGGLSAVGLELDE